MLFAASVIVQNVSTLRYNNCALLIEAVSREEAFGKAHMIGLKFFPSSEGYINHQTYVTLGDDIIRDPKDAVIKDTN